MSKTKECCSLKAHKLSSLSSIHMERNINHHNHWCCSSAAFICYQQSLGNSRVFLMVLSFFCLCPRLLTWHSSLKFHFKKEEGQESWKLLAPSSRLGGGGGGNERGATQALLLRPWAGLLRASRGGGTLTLWGLSLWVTTKTYWPEAGKPGEMTMGSKTHRQHKSKDFLSFITVWWSSKLIQSGSALGMAHFLTAWNNTLLKIRFEFALSRETMSICNCTTWPWEKTWDVPSVGALPFAWVGGTGWLVVLILRGVT